ncbi:MAG: YggT family protein [Nocardioidaceae bacterium]|jgi:YggT family protein|nr:YggT family protein [Nocardioidaceae bacterium]
MRTAGEIISFVLLLALLFLLARIVLDWVQMLSRSWRPSGFVLVVCEVIYSVTDPPLRAIRAVLPPVRIGMVALDLSPLVLFVVIYILRAVNAAVFLS